MKKVEEFTNSTSSARNDQEYPDVITPAIEKEEQEEDNMAAYSLLSKIEDPYYSKESPAIPLEAPEEAQEGKKHNKEYRKKDQPQRLQIFLFKI